MKVTVHVEGMGCEKCVAHVTEALDSLKGTEDISVNLAAGTAVFTTSRDVADADIKDVIDEAGYSVKSIERA